MQCRLALLYILQKADIPLRERQLARIVGDVSIMNFFDLKDALHDLVDSGEIEQTPTLDGPVYTLTMRGMEMIDSLRTDLLHSTREAVGTYLAQHKADLEREAMFPAGFVRVGDREYRAQGRILSDGLPIFEVSLIVGTREEANTFVANWKEKGSDIYQRILLELTV